MDEGQQRTALDAMAGGLDGEGFEDARQYVDGLHQRLLHPAAGGVRLGARIADQQRHAHRRLEEELLLAQAVVAEEIAMVTGEDDQVSSQRPLARMLEEPAELVVDLADQPHVGRYHLPAHVFAGEIEARDVRGRRGTPGDRFLRRAPRVAPGAPGRRGTARGTAPARCRASAA